MQVVGSLLYSAGQTKWPLSRHCFEFQELTAQDVSNLQYSPVRDLNPQPSRRNHITAVFDLGSRLNAGLNLSMVLNYARRHLDVWEVEEKFHALNGGEWSASTPTALQLPPPPEERTPDAHWISG
jgi:hypothetical protein